MDWVIDKWLWETLLISALKEKSKNKIQKEMDGVMDTWLVPGYGRPVDLLVVASSSMKRKLKKRNTKGDGWVMDT